MANRGLLLLGLVMIMSLAACEDLKLAELPIPPSNLLGNPEQIAGGRKLFAAHCTECHGSIAEGRTQRAARLRPTPPDFHELRYRRTLPGYIYLRIKRGRKMEPFNSQGSVMPSWGVHFNQEQIWSLVAYIRYRAAPLNSQ